MKSMPNKRATKHVWMIEEAPPREGAPPRSFWTKIGVAVENEDGSLSLTLSAIPVSGRMVIREPVPLAGHDRSRGVA